LFFFELVVLGPEGRAHHSIAAAAVRGVGVHVVQVSEPRCDHVPRRVHLHKEATRRQDKQTQNVKLTKIDKKRWVC